MNDELTSNGQLKLFLNNGTGVFTNVTATHVVAAEDQPAGRRLVRHRQRQRPRRAEHRQVDGPAGVPQRRHRPLPLVNTSLLPAGTGLTYEAEAADLDHDGDLDLTMLSVSGLSDTVIRNNLIPSGTLGFTSLTTALTGGNGDDDNEWLFVDANNDGFLDLVNGSLQSNGDKLYLNNGAFSFARQTGTAGFSPLVDSTLDATIGDLNGDGVFDIVTAQGESGSFLNRAYYGTGPADTQPPRFVRVEQLPAMSTQPDGPWVVRAVIQDSAVDDGETSVASARIDWTITHPTGTSTGTTPLRFLGGLLFRGADRAAERRPDQRCAGQLHPDRRGSPWQQHDDTGPGVLGARRRATASASVAATPPCSAPPAPPRPAACPRSHGAPQAPSRTASSPCPWSAPTSCGHRASC